MKKMGIELICLVIGIVLIIGTVAYIKHKKGKKEISIKQENEEIDIDKTLKVIGLIKKIKDSYK